MALLTTATVTANVVVKSVNGSLQSTGKVNPVTLVNIGGSGAGLARFDQLADVTEGTPANGDIVVYNASNDKYEVKSLSNTSITLDGGDF